LLRCAPPAGTDIELNESCIRRAGPQASSGALAEVGVARAGQHSNALLSKLPIQFIPDAPVRAGDERNLPFVMLLRDMEDENAMPNGSGIAFTTAKPDGEGPSSR
jgi:hypothetical protein